MDWSDAPPAAATPSATPAATPIATPIPAELLPVDTRATPPPTTTRRGEYAWTDTFDALTPAKDLVAASSGAVAQYDGPEPTGKSLKDLAMSLGAPPSFAQLLVDMQEALLGVIGDLTGSTGSDREGLADIVTHNNRLRGIGALLVTIALVGMAVDALHGGKLPGASD